MKKLSLKNRILKYYQNHYPEWIHKGDIETLAKSAKYLGETADRRLREMASGSLSDGRSCPITLERHETREGYYRATPPVQTAQYTKENGDIILVHKW